MPVRHGTKGVSSVGKMYYMIKKHPLKDGIGKDLPDGYKRFWKECHQPPSPVHYIAEKGKYKRDPATGLTHPVQNIPIPLIYPKEFHQGLWGGCGIIKGFRQKDPANQCDPKYWIPALKKTIVYSEVLDKYMKVTVTDRTIQLINDNFGLDHYLLKTPASDLRADLALKLKREILLALDKNDLPHKDPLKRTEVYNAYKHYLDKYDSEYIEWYGLRLMEAVSKWRNLQQKAQGPLLPFKIKFRQELIQELSSGNIRNEEDTKEEEKKESKVTSRIESMFSKINPFSK